MRSETRVIVALDYPDAESALALSARLEPSRCRLKVGKELFTLAGPRLLEQLQRQGFEIFLDLKYHDIPNTVAGACRAAASLGVWMVNVHCSGGIKMLQAAADALATVAEPPKLVGVTVLTSLTDSDLAHIGIERSVAAQVSHLAALAAESGLDGVVCSPKEVAELRRQRGESFLLVTPGIRPLWASKDDQSRITTPQQAVALGSSYLVIGRPITAAEEPLEALARIEAELSL
ncbi:orotidine-5'-phosphate decarboxylase [Ectothiorhodospiraceae bacterium BW-2]|nr:orotidine-5'-phosphate decarboxylase [Ectothiorhodospiraceae bacterium BW-2]